MSEIYQRFALNNAYANRTLYQAISAMSEAEFTADRPGFFSSISRTLNHIYEVDLFYIDALEEGGQGRAVYDREDVVDVAGLAALQAKADLRLVRFCMASPVLARQVSVERKDEMSVETIGALLPHLFQHQVHHRGQAHVQIGEAGIAPPQLDDFFLEYGRAPIAQEYF